MKPEDFAPDDCVTARSLPLELRNQNIIDFPKNCPQDDLSIHIMRLTCLHLAKLTHTQKMLIISTWNNILEIKPIRGLRANAIIADEFWE